MRYHKSITYICILLLALPAVAKVTFNFTFEQLILGENIDAQLIENTKNQFHEAGEILGSYLNHDQSVDIQIYLSDNLEALFNSKMAAAALVFLLDPDEPAKQGFHGKQGFYGTILADKIQYGIDRNDERPDAYILFDILKVMDNEDCDIKKVIMHELIHTLGFTGKFNSYPTSNLYEGDGVFSKYDYYIQDANGNPLWEQKHHNSSFILKEPGYFAGPNTKMAFFGLPLPLPQNPESNDPDYYHSCGSDVLSFLFIGNMMNTIDSIRNELEPLRLSAIEIAILQDIGFDINIELAARTNELQQLLDYCPNLHNIEDKNAKLSIFSALINLLSEEEQAELRALLTEEEEPMDLSFLSNFNDASNKEEE
jgi:hypothetical protein